MILVDTNVISEALRPLPNIKVTEWLDNQVIETLFLSIITVTELRYGVARLPEGKRKKQLHHSLENEIFPLFSKRLLFFDLESSKVYAQMMAKARSNGLSISMADGYIAAIAKNHKKIVATRDTTPFQHLELKTINPWKLD